MNYTGGGGGKGSLDRPISFQERAKIFGNRKQKKNDRGVGCFWGTRGTVKTVRSGKDSELQPKKMERVPLKKGRLRSQRNRRLHKKKLRPNS